MGTDDEAELPGWALKLGLGAQWAWMSGRARGAVEGRGEDGGRGQPTN
jgi:hypothetical protein